MTIVLHSRTPIGRMIDALAQSGEINDVTEADFRKELEQPYDHYVTARQQILESTDLSASGKAAQLQQLRTKVTSTAKERWAQKLTVLDKRIQDERARAIQSTRATGERTVIDEMRHQELRAGLRNRYTRATEGGPVLDHLQLDLVYLQAVNAGDEDLQRAMEPRMFNLISDKVRHEADEIRISRAPNGADVAALQVLRGHYDWVIGTFERSVADLDN